MPPKAKKGNEPSKKTELKKKDKIIEDKTFGLKNKKGNKQQKFIKTVVHQQGQCGKGDKCKFSHDLNVARKAEKKNLYEDVRDEDKMENWDEQKLEEVVNQKHSESEKAKPKTSIRKEKIQAMKKVQDKKKTDFKQGKVFGFNPDLVQGDDDEAGDESYERDDDEDEATFRNVKDIDLSMFVPTECDGSGTKADRDVRITNGTAEASEAGKLDMAGALPPGASGGAEGGGEPSDADAAIAMAMAATKEADMNIEIDEALFDGEDLDLVDEDLETLDLDD
ncbi:ZC3HF-like protein [Mya arenaria]|uniref:ZC3HF-like protein n=1 Tax=Mya arenaria TaxID=6604 RepID=A0ABY7ELB5_MYAAR|nr:ZC3HF-like protein [Mya arenaria]